MSDKEDPVAFDALLDAGDPVELDVQIGWTETKASRSRKNTHRWCKGKPGRLHQTVLALDPYYVGMDRKCGRTAWSRRWWCYHVVMCEVCGKRLRRWLGADCPDYQQEN